MARARGLLTTRSPLQVFGTSNELTLNDMWSLDVAKLDGWRCVEVGNAPQEADEPSDDGDNGSGSDDSADSSDDESGSDESDDEAAGAS